MRFSMGQLASRLAPLAYSNYIARDARQQRERLGRLLSESISPALLDNAQFDALMARPFPRAAAYDYDPFSSTARAAVRIQRLAALFPMLKSRKDILEVSCGDGLVGALIAHGEHRVTLTDVRDWRSEPARHLGFTSWDVCSSPVLEPEQFDLVVAYNATEHWEDPPTALRNLLSLCRKGGFVLLDFGPLFNSPWGLHAWSLSFPYPQFLFSRQLIENRVREIGVSDLGVAGATMQPTNGWPISAFRELWSRCGAKVVSNAEDRDYRYLNFIEEFATCFKGRGLGFDDVTVNSIEIVLEKT